MVIVMSRASNSTTALFHLPTTVWGLKKHAVYAATCRLAPQPQPTIASVRVRITPYENDVRT